MAIYVRYIVVNNTVGTTPSRLWYIGPTAVAFVNGGLMRYICDHYGYIIRL